jgi:DNA (cytosine-5)-methyltransferase 1
MNYLNLFSGVGGFRQGLCEAGFTFEWEGHSEINKYASSVYERHFSKSEVLGDVKTIRTNELPRIDLITFGFPCQDLSLAGKRKGLSGQRSGLFYRAMQIIREVNPRYFIFENVKGLFSSNDGRDFVEVLKEVADVGYDGQWQMLNTSWFLPQNRERIYFVGYPRGTTRPKIFPIGKEVARSNERATKTTNIRTITAGANSGGLHSGMTLIDKDNISIRRLTPIECERLQGFSDNWTEWGKNGEKISDSQRYKMIGNAVSVPVVKAIFERIIYA